MKETLSAASGVNDKMQTGTQPQARSEPQVVQLEHYREARLAESVSEVRRRLRELQSAKIQAELRTWRLLRELAALQRELRDCRTRMIQSGMLE